MSSRRVAVRHISPLSAFKTALALSLTGLAAWIICVIVLYMGLDAAGVWDKANEVIAGVGGEQVLNFGITVSLATLVGAIFALIATFLAPLVAIIYNAVVDLFGGVVITIGDVED
ncbi:MULTISPECIES: DUF3566 domain-containing protein [Corynebacterium]|uniref:DUF3566 domain-containing protein n=1 Tax=Corynebacterium TaxID=1716 RepID=UPI00124D2D77|nr:MULTISPECIES: DUF3566 domain-containing protein [Corynebacterium]